METFSTIIALVIIVFGILQIILFFKIWGMTNDVAQIRTTLERLASKNNSPREECSDQSALKPGTLIVRKSNEDQLRIYQVNQDGTYTCTKGGIEVGVLDREDFYTWDEWLEYLKSNK